MKRLAVKQYEEIEKEKSNKDDARRDCSYEETRRETMITTIIRRVNKATYKKEEPLPKKRLAVKQKYESEEDEEEEANQIRNTTMRCL